MPLSRRSFLRGLGGSVLALPTLEAFATPTTTAPRLLVYYLPNGRRAEWWVPTVTGGNLVFPSQSSALQPFADRMISFVALDNVAARQSPGAAHAAGTSTVMTGVPIRSLPQITGQLGITLDQLVAQHHGTGRFQSLQWSAGEPGPCDVGGSACAYTQSISWAGAGQPLVPTIDPRAAFERLFAVRTPALTSVLDAVREDANDLRRRLGVADQARLDEYFTSVESLERTLTSPTATCAATPSAPGTGLSYEERVQAFEDLIVLAFQCNQTRVLSFMIEFGLSGRAHGFLGSTGGHHALSHYGNVAQKAELEALETWQGQRLASLLQRLATTPSGGGMLLDDTIVLAMPSMGEGSSHAHDACCPLIISGSDCVLADGRQHSYGSATPLANLHATLLAAYGISGTFGANGAIFGESGTSVLSGVVA